MNKWVILALVAGVLLLGLAGTAVAGYLIYTRVIDNDRPAVGWMFGPGGMMDERRERMQERMEERLEDRRDNRGGFRQNGGMGGMMENFGELHNFMHDEMVAAFADALGLTVDELQKRLDSGESMYEIATAEGMSDGEFIDAMQAARDTALDKAVEQGIITEEQAGWMREHRPGMMGRRMGPGMMEPGFMGPGMMERWNTEPTPTEP